MDDLHIFSLISDLINELSAIDIILSTYVPILGYIVYNEYKKRTYYHKTIMYIQIELRDTNTNLDLDNPRVELYNYINPATEKNNSLAYVFLNDKMFKSVYLSGKLINLKYDSVQKIQNVYEYIDEYNTYIEEFRKLDDDINLLLHNKYELNGTLKLKCLKRDDVCNFINILHKSIFHLTKELIEEIDEDIPWLIKRKFRHKIS